MRRIQTVHWSWNTFVSHLESHVYIVRPSTYKMLRHINKDIKESVNIKCGPTKENP
jgi:hypothetical protein